MWGERNFWELFIHHVATVFSIIFCYFTNFEDYGPFILIASDLSDSLLNLGKLYRDIYDLTGILGDVMFIIVSTTWLLTRNIFLQGCWYNAIKKYHPFVDIKLANPEYDHLM
jgi:TLC domain